MAESSAFVDVVADTSGTADQLESDMERLLDQVESALDALDIQAALDEGTEGDLRSQIERTLDNVSASIDVIAVRADMDPDAAEQLIVAADILRDRLEEALDDIQVGVDDRELSSDLDSAIDMAEGLAETIDVEVDVDTDRLRNGLAAAGRAGLGVAMSIGRITAAAGAALPAVAGIVAALQQMAPAAAVGVSAMLAMKQATGVAKIAMIGMGDAIEAAMDPEATEEFEKALKKLSPEARKFAVAVREAQPALDGLRRSIQDRVFKGLADDMQGAASSVLPTLKKEALGTADALNSMAKGVISSAAGLGKSGVLGQAMGSATQGIKNLSKAPGLVVTGLGKIAAAAGPSFEKLTAGGAGALEKLSAKIDAAFKSGAMQEAIETAIATVKQLFTVLGNVGAIFKNIMGAAQQSGGGLIGVLQEITGALRSITADPSVQAGFKAIFGAMSVAAKTIAPLLGAALRAIAPAVVALAEPFKVLVTTLGAALMPIIKALAPVLLALSRTVGSIVVAFAPLLTTIGQLVAALLPALTPLLTFVANLFTQLAPIIKLVADVLVAALKPILAQLPVILQPLLNALMSLVNAVLPVFMQVVKQLAPSLVNLGTAFGEVFKELGPVIAELAVLYAQYLKTMVPLLIPIISMVAKLAAFFADHLARVLREVVVPAFRAIAALLRGDFRGAFNNAKAMIQGWMNATIRLFVTLPMKVISALSSLASKLRTVISGAMRAMVNAITERTEGIRSWFSKLPGRISGWLGNLGSTLVNAGRALVQGFINGLKSMLGSVKDVAKSIVGAVSDFMPGSPAKTGPFSGKGWTPYRGKALVEGFAEGIQKAEPGLTSTMSEMSKKAAKKLPKLPNMPKIRRKGTTPGPGEFDTASGPRNILDTGPGSFDTIGGPKKPREVDTAPLPEINVQVFIGETELTSIIDARVERRMAVEGRSVRSGVRR